MIKRIECHSTVTQYSFCESINILVNKPHVINKRLWGSKLWGRLQCDFTNSKTNCSRPSKLLDDITDENLNTLIISVMVDLCITKSNSLNSDVEIVLIELLPKNFNETHAFQLLMFNKINLSATFYNITPDKYNQNLIPDFEHTLKFDVNAITLSAKTEANSKSYIWLKNKLLPQFVKWAQECSSGKVQENICNESLGLVSKTKYYQTYNKLKLKYGKDMVKIWPECTDPSKFVYEDVAIATYLLLLWEKYDSTLKKMSFVDLGCGNGLLVYILTKEGHKGLGIDVRKRQIWDMYPHDVKLKVSTIMPSDFSLFPETDWIIGNHSDELTPWIPVIAARSSYKCNFFLLPCCAYNFDGTKYQRKNTMISQYTDYIVYLNNLCKQCGFNVDMDRLKIPSTKRVCLVSSGRFYSETQHLNNCNEINNLIKTEDESSTSDNKECANWINKFKPREAVEIVRNCTQIDKNIINSILEIIAHLLLEGCHFENSWSNGKTLDISELVSHIPLKQLKALKSECGGLKTLLKNHHHIFQVQSGKVQFRYPKTIDEVNKDIKARKRSADIKLQQKPCWFHNYHPHGCPLTSVSCSFLHSKI